MISPWNVSGKAAAWRVLGMMPSLRKSATLQQTDTWHKEHITARTRIHVSLLVVQMQQRRMAGVAATSMRSTRPDDRGDLG